MPKGDLIIKDSYEWYSEKNEINKKKHGISFEDAIKVFNDPCFYEIKDDKNSTIEQERFCGIGTVDYIHILHISYTVNSYTHIISARYVSPKEMEEYCERLERAY